MDKILYIASLGHAGSTVLELVLSNSDDIIGIGEIENLYKMVKNKGVDSTYESVTCSCGNNMNNCSYWSGFKDIHKNTLNMSFKEFYRVHFDYFKSKYPNKYMLDNSKTATNLNYLSTNLKEIEFIPIFLIKDVRSWVYSQMKRVAKCKFIEYIRWYYSNRKIENEVKKHKEVFYIGYEEFAFVPDKILKTITDKLGASELKSFAPKTTNAHSVLSNRMRTQKDTMQKITYDFRWLKENRPFFENCLIPIMNFNKKFVYGNSEKLDIFTKKKK